MAKVFIQGVCILGAPFSRTSNKDILLNVAHIVNTFDCYWFLISNSINAIIIR